MINMVRYDVGGCFQDVSAFTVDAEKLDVVDMVGTDIFALF